MTALALPRRDRWVITLVVMLLGALIMGFAASAPAFEAWGSGNAGQPGEAGATIEDATPAATAAGETVRVETRNTEGAPW